MSAYASEYRSVSYEDIWYSSCDIESESEYNRLKNMMLKRVYENGGFYIGKYETATDTHRTSTKNELTTPKIKEELFPYIQVNMNQAQELASRFSKGNRNGSLMFGIQWDVMCNYIEVQGQEYLGINAMENSNNWGNYYFAKFDIYKGLYSEDDRKNYTSFEAIYNKAEKMLFCYKRD